MHQGKFLVLLTLISAAALAQTSGTLQGTWTGTTKGQGGGELVVELVLSEATGAWRFIRQGNQARKNPCLDKDFPVVVVAQSAIDLSIKIDGAKVLQGCMDQSATFKSADGKSLEGTLSDGRAVTLNRK